MNPIMSTKTKKITIAIITIVKLLLLAYFPKVYVEGIKSLPFK